MSVRWGLLSTARINDAFLAGVRATGSDEVIAVAGRDAERTRDWAQARAIPRALEGYDALLTDPEIDAVYISLPNGLHLPWTERALRAGKHVLCEKPLGRHPDAVAAAFDLAGSRGLVLAEAFMYRHHPQTVRLAELVAQGAIGPLRMIRASFDFVLSDPADVRLQGELEGGALMDLGCYCVNAARLLAGEPEAVAGVAVAGGAGVDVSFAGALRFPGGVLAHFDAGFQSDGGGTLVVAGERGTLRVPDPWHIRAPGIELHDGTGTRAIEIPGANAYRLEAEDFAAAVGGAAPRLGGEDAIGQARTIASLYAAAA